MNIKNNNVFIESTPECPLFTVKYKRWIFYLIIIFFPILICNISYSTIVPLISIINVNSSFASVVGLIFNKLILFIMLFILIWYLPTTVQLILIGDVAIYNTHVEVDPIISFFGKRIIIYENMHIKYRDNRGLILIDGAAPDLIINPLGYWKSIYYNGIVITAGSIVLNNSEKLQQVLDFVRSRAVTITKL